MAAIGVTGLAWPGPTAAAPSTVPPAPAPHLLGVLGSDEAVCDIGRSYRALVPGEDDAGVLRTALASPPPADAADDPAQWVAARIRQDFSEGLTVTVEGWILSVTEARQCALYSLLRA